MENKEKDSLKILLAILLFSLVILFAGLPKANAFASTYLPNKTMELHKGETGEYCVYLQNIGEEDITQIIKVFEGQEYIRNLDEISQQFNVPAGTRSDDLPACMKVKLPRSSEKGVKYLVSYGVTSPPAENKEGMVSFAPVQIRKQFYLTESLEKRENNKPVALYAGFAIAAIVLIIVFYVYRKIKSRNAKK